MVKAKKDTSRFLLVSEQKDRECIRRTFFVGETGDEFVQRKNYLHEAEYLRDEPESYAKWIGRALFKAGDFEYHRSVQTAQKFMCLGGPLNGQRHVELRGYVRFNRGEGGRGKHPGFSGVLVHQSLLDGKG